MHDCFAVLSFWGCFEFVLITVVWFDLLIVLDIAIRNGMCFGFYVYVLVFCLVGYSIVGFSLCYWWVWRYGVNCCLI